MKNGLIFAALAGLSLTLRADDKIDFTKSIKPILEKRCVECHGAEKHKGELRLDSLTAVLKGGDGGPALVPGKADESSLFKRVALPPDHDDIMPPKGDPLTKEEIATLKQWINDGAVWPEGVVLGKETPAAKEKADSTAAASVSTGLHADDKIDFAKTIRPILEKRCVECHGEEKHKAELRLDSGPAVLKGGDGGPALVPGKADESALVKRVALPPDHDDIMPPKGDPLSKEEIEALKQWINQGAVWPEGVVLGKESPAAKAAAAKKKAGSEFEGLKKSTDTAAEKQAIEKLAALGISVRPIAQNMEWKEATVRPQDTNKTSEAVALLKDIPSLVDLNLAGLKISDSDLDAISSLSNLLRLHLENTPITDAGLAKIKGLTNLRYLNLYNTQVSDAGLEHLKGMNNLGNLYLWQTKVTDEGVAALKQAIADANINRGEELKLLAQAAEKKAEDKDAKAEEKK